MSRLITPIRLERRLDMPRWLTLAMPFASGAIALAVAALVLLASGQHPIATYRSMIEAAVTSTGALSSTFASATPLLFTGLAAGVAFRVRIWNIGGEGQLYMGGVAAAGAGIALGPQGLGVALPAMVIAGALGGALWAAIPGLLRAYLNTNEILTSLMLNYVAGLVMYWLIFDSASYWRDLSTPAARSFPQGKPLDPAAYWPGFVGGGLLLPLGFVVGTVLAIALLVLIARTRFGFQLRVIADSPLVGRYAGMRTQRTLVVVMLLSGALAGIGGASQVGDFSHVLEPRGLQQAAFGYTGIVVAALARYNPVGAIAGAVFLGGLTNAGFRLQGPSFPQGLVGTIEGIVLFCVLSGDVLVRYRVRLARRRQLPAEALYDAEPEPASAAPALDPAAGRPA